MRIRLNAHSVRWRINQPPILVVAGPNEDLCRLPMNLNSQSKVTWAYEPDLGRTAGAL